MRKANTMKWKGDLTTYKWSGGSVVRFNRQLLVWADSHRQKISNWVDYRTGGKRE